jgi:hypothetical protein
MCSNWLINGKLCRNGSDLVAAIGSEAARRVNASYEMIGETVWKKGPDGERIEYEFTDAHVAGSCLCGVEPDRMDALTGDTWTYDCDEDAFIPLPHNKDSQ